MGSAVKNRRSRLHMAIPFAALLLLVADIAGVHGEPWHVVVWVALGALGWGLTRLWLIRNAASALSVHRVTLVAPYYPHEAAEYSDRLPTD